LLARHVNRVQLSAALCRDGDDLLRRFLAFIVPLAQYSAAVVAVTVGAMLLLPFAGYATYGDRPPAGWREIGPISASEYAAYTAFVGEFAVFLLLTVLFYGAIALGGVRLCEAAGGKRIGPKAAGALGGGIAAFLSLAGAGWYVSLGLLPGIVGSIAGLIAGVRWLPRRPAVESRPAAA
jgi:hypothetical protein